jgi:hypothetical protein
VACFDLTDMFFLACGEAANLVAAVLPAFEDGLEAVLAGDGPRSELARRGGLGTGVLAGRSAASLIVLAAGLAGALTGALAAGLASALTGAGAALMSASLLLLVEPDEEKELVSSPCVVLCAGLFGWLPAALPDLWGGLPAALPDL